MSETIETAKNAPNTRIAIRELRLQAARCRKMADAAVTKGVAELLRKNSREYEFQAATLEAQISETAHTSSAA